SERISRTPPGSDLPGAASAADVHGACRSRRSLNLHPAAEESIFSRALLRAGAGAGGAGSAGEEALAARSTEKLTTMSSLRPSTAMALTTRRTGHRRPARPGFFYSVLPHTGAGSDAGPAWPGSAAALGADGVRRALAADGRGGNNGSADQPRVSAGWASCSLPIPATPP